MARTQKYVISAAGLLALLLSANAPAQLNRGSIPAEEAGVAREAAVEKAARPLIEAARAKPYLGGYWKIGAPIKALTTADGKAPPLNAAGKAQLKKIAAERKAGRNPDPMEVCLPPGTPRALLVDKPFMIAHSAIKLTFFHQIYHVIRHVYLDGPLNLDDNNREELWEGQSSGRWDGNVLVIETGNFNGQQWLDDSGLPQSVDMRVTERITRPDADTLEDVITYDDARYYTKPWTARLVFKALPRSTILVEEDCAEKLLDFPMKPYAP